MEFLKKNWAKLAIAILMVLAGVVYIVALIVSDAPVHIFKQSAGTVAALVFFFGITAYMICKMLNQKWAKWILLGVGIVGTVFATAFLIWTIDNPFGITIPALGPLGEIVPELSFFENLAFRHSFTFLVVFGLIPLIKGIKKVVSGDKKAAAK